mgnify:CR=1 FL=1
MTAETTIDGSARPGAGNAAPIRLGPVVRARPAGALRDVATIAGRSLRAVPRDLEAVIPPVLMYRGGVLQGDIERLILANVRTPGERRGDLNAQLAWLRVGANA